MMSVMTEVAWVLLGGYMISTIAYFVAAREAKQWRLRAIKAERANERIKDCKWGDVVPAPKPKGGMSVTLKNSQTTRR